jgi:microcystin-dependent protein
MASSYSDLKIQLMATGENSGTWGNVTNVNLGTAIEEAITGSADVVFSNADLTLTLTDTNSSQTARNLRLNLTGSVAAEKNLVVPAIEKVYIVNNTLTFAITVKNATGTGIEVPAGKTMYVYNDGTNVVDAITHLTSLTLGTPLPAGSGGTGATSLNSEAVIIGNATSAVKFVAPGGSGNVLTSNGTAWTSSAAQGFDSGTVMLFAQTSAPTGWTKDTSNFNNSALRVVTGSVVNGGSVDFTTAFASKAVSGSIGNTTAGGSVGVSLSGGGSVSATTLATSQIPSHTHPASNGGSFGSSASPYPNVNAAIHSTNSGAAGGGGSHTHGFTNPSYSGSFTGTAHNHTFTGTAINMAVKYVDVIRATKN